MDVRQNVYDYLNEMGIEYTVDEHEASLYNRRSW